MATVKKIKPVSNEFSNINSNANNQTGSKATVLEALEAEKPMTSAEFSDEVKLKLESVEKIENANAELSREKSELEQKISEYIEEITGLKQQIAEMKTEKTTFCAADSTIRLNAEIAELRLENDKALMKISDLTFENAKLTAELQERSNRDQTYHNQVQQYHDNFQYCIEPDNTSNNKQSAIHTRTRKLNVYRNVAQTNGYSDWN